MGKAIEDQMGAFDRQRLVLGIETSCDETAAAVVQWQAPDQGRIRANIVRSQLAEHVAFGGVVPEIAARAHVEGLDALLGEAMRQAGLEWKHLDAVAVTAGPGLVGGLLVGMMTAKALALVHDLPLLAINHLEAHALTVGLTNRVVPPYLLLLVSGGHTQTLGVTDAGGKRAYRRFGTTVDDALGEAFDKTAKLLGLGYPGGPAVERMAAKGDGTRFRLPRPMLGREEAHFSFSGLKTAVRQQAIALKPLRTQDVADLCASFQAAVVDSLCDRVARAMTLYEHSCIAAGQPRTLVVAGGVAANRAIRQGVERLAAARGYRLVIPPAEFCTDNAAMVAWAGALRLQRGGNDGLAAPVRARWPLDPAAEPAPGAGVKA